MRVRPVVMTALAAFFALVPMALALERGSEANAPLGRAVIGGLAGRPGDDVVRRAGPLFAAGQRLARRSRCRMTA